jgi:flavodoxin
MKHESIVVVYDSGQAIAEEIADKLGAETISVQSVNNRQIENCQSLVLAVEFQSDGFLTPHWQYVYLLLSEVNLSGKNIAVVVAQGNKRDSGTITKEFCDRLRGKGAHIIGDQLYTGISGRNLENWICAISPNL